MLATSCNTRMSFCFAHAMCWLMFLDSTKMGCVTFAIEDRPSPPRCATRLLILYRRDAKSVVGVELQSIGGVSPNFNFTPSRLQSAATHKGRAGGLNGGQPFSAAASVNSILLVANTKSCQCHQFPTPPLIGRPLGPLIWPRTIIQVASSRPSRGESRCTVALASAFAITARCQHREGVLLRRPTVL